MSISTDIFIYNFDEINQIAVDEKEKYLVVSDDVGEIRVIDLIEKKLYKILKNKYINICFLVCFCFLKLWEFFIGGLDFKVIYWDFFCYKCLNMFDMNELNNLFEILDFYMVSFFFVYYLVVSFNGKYLVVVFENGLIVVFDLIRKYLRELFSLYIYT